MFGHNAADDVWQINVDLATRSTHLFPSYRCYRPPSRSTHPPSPPCNQIDYHQVFLISDKTFRKWSVRRMRWTLLCWHLPEPESASSQMRRWLWFGSGCGYRERGCVTHLREMNNRFWQNVCAHWIIYHRVERMPAAKYELGMLYIINFCYSSSTICRVLRCGGQIGLPLCGTRRDDIDIGIGCQTRYPHWFIGSAGMVEKKVNEHITYIITVQMKFDNGRLAY